MLHKLNLGIGIQFVGADVKVLLNAINMEYILVV